MSTIMVNYDLNKPGQNYDDLIEYLKGLGPWWHHLDSCFLIKTSKSCVEVRDGCVRHVDSGDQILVIDVSGARVAWFGFNDSGRKWLRDNF